VEPLRRHRPFEKREDYGVAALTRLRRLRLSQAGVKNALLRGALALVLKRQRQGDLALENQCQVATVHDEDAASERGHVLDRNSAAYNAHRLNGYRRWLERPDSARAGEAPAAREVLLAVEKALRICAQHDELAVPESERLLATHWCARALTVAFMAGFVTSAPDEASAATDAIVSTR